MSRIQFGTDGWRAVIAEDFTFANVARVTQATADCWKANPAAGTMPTVVVGYDRRFFSDQFAQCVAQVMAANDLKVLLTPVPTATPAVSLAVKQHQAVGGVMITASHNPARFNGFKLKAHYGGPALPNACQAVESYLDKSPVRLMDYEAAVREKRILIRELRPPHYAAIKRLVDFKLISRSHLRFAHDALFGVGAGCFDDLLAGTTCRVTTLNGRHDTLFGGINPEPVEINYRPSQAWLRHHPHDVCLVTDGDADRVGGMDGRGNYVSTHQLICLLLYHSIKNRHGQGRVIKALSTTTMMDRMCAEYGLPLVEVGVGFKFTCAEMLKGDVLLGGEESGGIGFAGHIPERDGILAGLMLLELLAMERRSLPKIIAELEKRYGPHRFARVDIRFPLELRPTLMEFCRANPPGKLLRSPVAEVKTYDGVKYLARNGSWLMLRGSGTEPIVRIYAEAGTDAGAQQLLQQGLRMTRQAARVKP
ncbi:MAG: phosphoglucomutase/phosphomannomutase family protein [Verrucomicrobiota bacterium]